MKTSELLRLAADEHLAASMEDWFYTSKNRFSCDAVIEAADQVPSNSFINSWYLLFDALELLEKLGVKTFHKDQFSEFESANGSITEEAQGARFLWLHFAALVAEDIENGIIEEI